MKWNKIFTISLLLLSIGLVEIPNQNDLIATNNASNQVKTWADVHIDTLTSKVIFNEDIPNRLTVILKAKNLNATDSSADIANQINIEGALGFKVDINDNKNVIFTYNAINKIEEKDIIKDETDSTQATIICDFYVKFPIQIANNFYVATNKNSSWNWKQFSKDEIIVNALDLGDGSLVQVNYDQTIIVNNIDHTSAKIEIPLKYDETQILGEQWSYLIVQKSLKDLQIKANDTILEIKDNPVVNLAKTKETSNLIATINLINLKSNTKYFDFTIDLDGDWLTTKKDQFDLINTQFQTTYEKEGLSDTEVEILVIGILILIIVILLGAYLIGKR